MPFRADGSLWGKWDLHFHTPSSFDYQDKGITDKQIVDGLVSAGVVAVAITDHHLIDAGRVRNLQNLGKDVLTVFPGIELRSELGGSESVHLIGIFPETADPAHIWTKIQGPLNLTEPDVREKGDDHVYVHFEEAAELIHRLGGFVSAHVGRKSNSIENIGNNHPYKQAFKQDLARTHIDLFEIGRTSDIKIYRTIVFPATGLERPLIICFDNHDIDSYAVKAPCWIKADPAFEGFQQVISDPWERVYIGDTPPALERVQKNSTKYMKSISFEKTPDSNLNEDWFSGKFPLNPGLIAVIGNKGTGKTALVESIGLLGNTTLHKHFSFLHPDKFKQTKNNKASHFTVTLEWQDGTSQNRLLSDPVDADSLEAVGYIPQHYLEIICNEIQTSNSNFDKELKSVIFSHVDEANKLRADTLDELLDYRTQQIREHLEQLRSELSEINDEILRMEHQGSAESRQLLLNLIDEKKRELEAHEKAIPAAIRKPAADPLKQQELEKIAKEIEKQQSERAALAAQAKQKGAEIRAAAKRQAVATRILGRLRNFASSYETFIADATADCIELNLSPRNLVAMTIDSETPDRIRSEAKTAEDNARGAQEAMERQASTLQTSIEELTQQLDAPNVQYQTYLQQLEEWQQRKSEIVGDENQAGSINYVQAQIVALDAIPQKLQLARANRSEKVTEIYVELESLVVTYKSLYSPVQNFIESHALSAGKFHFDFEASIVCSGLEEKFFSLVNRGRKGSFCGVDEGQKVLKTLMTSADFDSKGGALAFAESLLDHLNYDRRETPAPAVSLVTQTKGGTAELDVFNLIFSLSYLEPRYSLKWSGKNIEELSPGERGTLLLIFYLLIDRRDYPLIIDQPEENVDNRTVYDVLVPCIKEARKKRQVIIVTHNPNLAVVCDADQVIHCSIDKQNKNKVTYEAGSLENPAINKFTIDVLEGTRPAFDRRNSKYQEPPGRF
jgi:ABC-type lipoprotein export system ATPase subunit